MNKVITKIENSVGIILGVLGIVMVVALKDMLVSNMPIVCGSLVVLTFTYMVALLGKDEVDQDTIIYTILSRVSRADIMIGILMPFIYFVITAGLLYE